MTRLEKHPTSIVSETVELRGEGLVKIGAYCLIEDRVVIDTGGGSDGSITIGSRSKIKAGCLLRGYGNGIHVGHRVSLGEYCLIAGHGGVTIGDFTMLGPYTMLNAASHITRGDDPFRFQGEMALGVWVGQDVWIGARSTVLDGVRIEDRSIVGAHSLVTRNIDSNVVAFGVPAVPRKTIKLGGLINESLDEL